MILGSKHVGAIFKCFNINNFMLCALVGVLIKCLNMSSGLVTEPKHSLSLNVLQCYSICYSKKLLVSWRSDFDLHVECASKRK